MEWLSNSYEWIIAAIGVLGASGFYAAITKAVKEIKEAVKENRETLKQGKVIIDKIKLYKADGFSKVEITDLMVEMEKFYKEARESQIETQEAINAIDNVWKMIKKLFVKKP